MDSKEIIIDGVDVSGCYFLNKGITNLLCTCLSEIDEECKYNSNCYFKQLQKEKFENLNNRQMVESAENLIYENSELYENLKAKKQECNKYKQALDEINNYIVYMKTFGDKEDTIRTIQKIIIQSRGG